MIVAINNFRNKIDTINSYLIIAMGFTLPISIAGTNILFGFLFIFWLLKANFKNDFDELKSNLLVKAVLLYLGIYILSFMWTSNFESGIKSLNGHFKWLALPLLILFIKQDHIKYYISSFLLAILFSEIISYLVFWEIIQPIRHATVYNPVIFMSHITYNPILAFALFIVLNKLLFENKLTLYIKIILVFFIVTMSINMFITGGRAGQVMYFLVISLTIILYFKNNLKKIILSIFFVIPFVFVVFYNTSNIFYDRVNKTYSSINSYSENRNTSLGIRLNYLQNTIEVVKNAPLLGSGIGSFKNEYLQIHNQKTPHVKTPASQPHNMYALVLVEIGLIGLFALLFIFYSLIKIALLNDNIQHKNLGIVLAITFMCISFSEIYLFKYFTAVLFIYFSAIVSKKFE